MRERFKESKKKNKFSRNIWGGRVCYASLGPGSAPRGRGRGKAGKRRWWRPRDTPLMPPIRPQANELVTEMSRQVLITDVSVSSLFRFCKKNI